MSSFRDSAVRQFGKPTGFLGRIAGWIMLVRPSNRERNLRTLALLAIKPTDTVLEIGFGPGFAIRHAADLASEGKVVGIDHSDVMLREARRRNRAALAAGRVDLMLGSADRLPEFPNRFDKVFAVNVFIFWDDPVAVLRGLREVMTPTGAIALAVQPRNAGATNADTLRVAERMANALRDAGFGDVRTEILEMAPVNTACVLGRTGE